MFKQWSCGEKEMSYNDLKIVTPFEFLEGLAFCKPFFANANVLCLVKTFVGFRLVSNSTIIYGVINNLLYQKFINVSESESTLN